MASTIELISRSTQETLEIGRKLGETFRGGEVVELCGPLGAGKTRLAKGLALGLGVPGDELVVSPTFVLVREYAGRLRFYHCDAYRLETADELLALGVEEMLEGGSSVVAIEWADRVPAVLAPDTFRVDLAHEDNSTRTIRITVPNEQRAAELRRLLSRGGRGVDAPRSES